MCLLHYETVDEIDLIELYNSFEDDDDELIGSEEEDNTFQDKSMQNEKNSGIELKDSFKEDELLVSEEENN